MCKVCRMRRTTGRDVRLRGSELKIENRAKGIVSKKNLISGMRLRVIYACWYFEMLAPDATTGN